MKNKAKLKDIKEHRIYVNDDMTKPQKIIQKAIRIKKMEEKRKGNSVNIGFQKIEVNKKEEIWNQEINALENKRRHEEKMRQFVPKSDRLCYIRVKSTNKIISIINIPAVTKEKDEAKDRYYEELSTVLHIGKEDVYNEITGGESEHDQSNDNRLRLIALAIEEKMKIRSRIKWRHAVLEDLKSLSKLETEDG
ncbi:hypothetical protein ILUMI_26799 [Ignelater luminosus]|uniref:Uncharacterized protein n=1 Tax=Ignelater luminosus TaxID=2038154 RepID=A0A8K0FYT2_IGNLU|nr:hypothetical protein ILUMI_26799 [Ignelater luminosus]